MIALRDLRSLLIAVCAIAIAACSNGRGAVEPTGAQSQGFTIGGAVSGLSGSGLVLQLNGAGDLTIPANGPFTFASSLADGAAFAVTIRTQPANPAQTCTATSSAGRVAAANVTTVAVVCTTGSTTFTVGGSVTGLVGTGLVLRNNGSEDLPIGADGEFIFPTAVATGAAYNVTVATAPANPAQTCTIENGGGVMGGVDVENVRVVCSAAAFTIGGTVSGLTGAGLLLKLNGAEELGVGADGRFTFTTRVASGAQYDVQIQRQPTGQNCTTPNGSGVVGGADVTGITVTCTSNEYTIGGEVTGLAPNSDARVKLRLRAGDRTVEHDVRRNGRFEFPTTVPNGVGYAVDVAADPTSPAQRCTVANPSGIVFGAPVTNVMVSCTTLQFRVGGNVSGLQGSSGGLTLHLNGANALAIASNGAFTFDAPLNSGARYEVTVAANPSSPPQTCTVSQGEGVVGNGDVRNVAVRCALNTYPISGTVTGLAGGRLVLENNGGDPVEVAADGAFRFPREIATGAAYNVTVRTQPASPRQSCTIANGAGTVAAAPVTNVAVTCTSIFSVGGTVSGLAAAGLVLRNNGGDDVTVNADGSFRFATFLGSGATYNVTIAAQGALPSQTCVVTNGSGTIGSADVTNVAVTCTTNSFTVGGTVTGLFGFGLSLSLNGGPAVAAGSGPFTFPPLPSGSAYSVTVATQPVFPPQTCTVASGAGTVGAANITDIVVNCI